MSIMTKSTRTIVRNDLIVLLAYETVVLQNNYFVLFSPPLSSTSLKIINVELHKITYETIDM